MKLRSSRRLRISIAVAFFLAIQIGVLILVLPEVARRYALDFLQSSVEPPVRIEDVDLNLFTGRVRIRNLVVEGRQGGRPVLSLPRVEFRFSHKELFWGAVNLRSLVFYQPQVFVERLEGNRFNIVEIVRPQENQGSGLDFSVQRIEIRSGTVIFQDRTLEPQSERVLQNISLNVGKISTSPELALTPTSFELRLSVGPGLILLTGSSTPFGDPPGIELAAQWKRLDPNMFAAYFPDRMAAEFPESWLSGTARYVTKHRGKETIEHSFATSGDFGPIRLIQPERPSPTLTASGLIYRGVRVDFLANRVRVDELSITEPRIILDRSREGVFNVAQIFSRAEPAPGPEKGSAEDSQSTPMGFEIGQLKIERGTLEFTDQSIQPVAAAVLENLSLAVNELSLAPNSKPARIEAEARLGEGSLQLAGQLRTEPFSTLLTVRGLAIPFEPFRGYVDTAWGGGTSRAKDLDGRFEISLAAVQNGSIGFGLKGQLEARELALVVNGAADAPLNARSIAIELGPLVTKPAFAAEINRVRLVGANLSLARDQNGKINLERLWVNSTEAASEAPKSSTTESSISPIKLRRLEIDQSRVMLSDRTVEPEVVSVLSGLRLAMTEVPLSPNARPGQIDAAGSLDGSRFRLKGTIHFSPFTARLSLNAERLSLQRYQGYLAPVGNVKVSQGEADGRLQISVATTQSGQLNFGLGGTVETRNLVVGIPGVSKPPFKADEVMIDVASLSTHPALSVDVNSVRLVGPNVRIERDSEGTLNLERFKNSAQTQESKVPSEPSAGAGTPGYSRWTVGSLEVIRGRMDFADATVQPPFETALSEVKIQLGKVGQAGEKTPITLQAKLDGSASLELKGWFTSLGRPLKLQIEGEVSDYDLANLNPYANKYIRYDIQRGRVTTDIEYSYDEGNLAGENEIAVRHLQLGQQLGKEFENQVGIPLKLALALLEDVDGRIRLRIPVSGDLNSPEFSIASIVWKAVRNAFIKFLAAPFRLLGNILTVGGKIGEIRIDPVEFIPGSTDLSARGAQQLKELAEFLKNKPRLEVELRGYASRKEIGALKKVRLQQEIKPKAGEGYEKAIAQLYKQAGGKVSPNQPLSLEVMEGYLSERYQISDEDLRKLGEGREQLVGKVLAEMGLERKRIFAKRDDTEIVTDAPTGRVGFELLY